MRTIIGILTAVLIASPVSADNKTDNLSVSFETEEEFVEHLINKSIDLYAPKRTVDIGLRNLFYDDQISITVNLKDAQIKLYAPFGVVDEKYDGTLLTIEYRF